MGGGVGARGLGWRFVPSGLVFGLVLRGPERSEAIEGAHGLADGIAGDMSIQRRGLELGMPKRPRVIMRSFYVIESQRSAEQDLLLAGAARHSAHDARQHPRL